MAKVSAVSTLGYADFDLQTAIKNFAQQGWPKIEIAEMHSYCHHFTVGQVDIAQTQKLFDDCNVTPIGINYYCGSPTWAPGDSSDEHIATYKQMLHGIKQLGIPIAVVTSGRRTDSPDRAYQVKRWGEIVGLLGKYAATLGIRLLLEAPHCFGLCNNLENTVEMINAINSDNVGLLLDSSHWGVLKYDLDEYIDLFGEKLWHIHLRDSAGEDTNDFQQDLELTPGKGEVDFALLAKKLDQIGYDGEVSLEFEYRNGFPIENIPAEFTAGINHLKQCGWEFDESLE